MPSRNLLKTLFVLASLLCYASGVKADSTVTALTAASALTGAELLYCVQAAADRKCTVNQVPAIVGTMPVTSGVSGTVLFNNASVLGGVTNLTSDGTNLTGARIKSTTSLDWDSGAAAVDVSLFRDAASILAQRISTTAQTFRVYNTFTDASNYERGVIDWTTTANQLTLGAQAAGTGTLRNVWIVGTKYFFAANSTVARGAAGLDAASGIDGFSVRNTGAFMWSNDTNNNSSSTTDTGIYRPATGVIVLSSVLNSATFGTSANAWMQWAGQTRVTADVTNATTALATVTGLSVNVQAGRTYSWDCQLSWTDAAAGGLQLAMAGTATHTNIIYDGWIVDSGANGIKGNAQAAAIGGVVASAVTTGTAGHAEIHGTTTVNAAGTFLVQFAENTSNATATTIKRGSFCLFNDMP